MKVNVKKILVVGISVVMALATFSSCKPAESKKAEGLRGDLDFGGQELKFVYPPGMDMLNKDGSNAQLVQRDDKILATAEKYNCTVKQKEGKGNYFDVMANSIAAGSPEGHIMVATGKVMVDWVNAGAMADLTPAMEETGIDFMDDKWSQVTRQYTNYSNKQYGFADKSPYPTGSFFVFNKQIFADEQLEDPYVLMKNKQWTWDKVHELATKATKRSPDGNITQYGFGSWMHSDFLTQMSISNGGGVADYNRETGEPEFALSRPESMAAFDLLYKWTNVDKIARISTGNEPWDAVMKEFANGSIAIMQSTPKVIQIASESNMKDDYGVAYNPMGPNVKEYTQETHLAETYFIPVTYQDMTSKLLLFMDEVFTHEADDTLEDRVAARNNSRVRDEDSLKILTDMTVNTKNYRGDITAITGIDWSTPSITDICTKVMNGSSTPNEEVEKNKDKFVVVMKDKMAGLTFTGKAQKK